MTVAPDVQPLACYSAGDAIAVLRERGFRLTASRRLVIDALFAADGPVSADHLTRQLSLDLTSVYRNLETLESQGIVRHVHLGHGPGLYALLGRGAQEYLYCEVCGAVEAVTPEQLDAFRDVIHQAFGYQARFTHFAIVGTCRACADQPARADQAPGAGSAPKEGPRAHSHGNHVHAHSHAHPSHEHGHAN